MGRKKTAYMAMLVALAMILSYVESLTPALVAVPGVKAGFANIVVIFALYRYGLKEAIGISLVRIFMIALLFGSVVSLMYSFAGATLSLLCMCIAKKTDLFSTIAVSVVGGVMHNVGQIIVACIVLNTTALKYYLPVLLISGIISGVLTGTLAALIIKRLELKKE